MSAEWVPTKVPVRKSLSPSDVERLEKLGYDCKVVSISSMRNGRRICIVTKPKEQR